MKKLVYILFFLCSFANVFSQDNKATEKMPEFKGGINELMKFVQDNLVYPQKLKESTIGGKVFIKFLVDSSGAITNAEVIRSSGFEELDNEALRVVKIMPNWIPGSHEGKNVAIYFNLPVNFSLAKPYYMLNISKKNDAYIGLKSQILEGNHQLIIDKLKGLMTDNSDDAEYFYLMGVAHSNLKNEKKSCEFLRKAAQLKHSVAEKNLNNFCN